MIFTAFTAGFCLYLVIINYIERRQHIKIQRELLDRIMSRDFADFTAGEVALQTKPNDQNDDFYQHDFMPIV